MTKKLTLSGLPYRVAPGLAKFSPLRSVGGGGGGWELVVSMWRLEL